MSGSAKAPEPAGGREADGRRILITGGCGFIGCNLAAHYMGKGWEVIAYDDFSHPGADKNAAWLESLGGGKLRIVRADVLDGEALRKAVQGVDVVVHLAAQVAVPASIQDPMQDFRVNALGGIMLLQAVRMSNSEPVVLYASTSRLYGGLEHLSLEQSTLRYHLPELPKGIPEDSPLDQQSPYSCSKGACDAYMINYARYYDLKTVVFRLSSIYGPHQYGREEQGWMAHFVISAVLERPITIHGDGRQVRDFLHVQDLIAAFEKAVERIDGCRGHVYNLGGGPRNAASLLEVIYLLESILDRAIPLEFVAFRPGDRRLYVSDIRKTMHDLDWGPSISIREGLRDLLAWVEDSEESFEERPHDKGNGGHDSQE